MDNPTFARAVAARPHRGFFGEWWIEMIAADGEVICDSHDEYVMRSIGVGTDAAPEGCVVPLPASISIMFPAVPSR
jgi:hypothetical protein